MDRFLVQKIGYAVLGLCALVVFQPAVGVFDAGIEIGVRNGGILAGYGISHGDFFELHGLCFGSGGAGRAAGCRNAKRSRATGNF